jgi:hypothetical protein
MPFAHVHTYFLWYQDQSYGATHFEKQALAVSSFGTDEFRDNPWKISLAAMPREANMLVESPVPLYHRNPQMLHCWNDSGFLGTKKGSGN